MHFAPILCWLGGSLQLMCSLCTPQCVLQPPFLKHLIISPPIIGFWAAGAFGSLSCVWCSHVRFGCRSQLHTHPAHSEMQMGSLCAFLFFWQALFLHGTPIFSARQVTKNAKKKIGPAYESTPLNQQHRVQTTGPLPCTTSTSTYICSGTMYRPRDDCKSVLHTHPAHSEMQMGSLCASICFQQALIVHGRSLFSARQLQKMHKNSSP